jgi:hypothetical protein
LGKGEKRAVPLAVAVLLFGFAWLFLALLLSGRVCAIPIRLRVMRNHFGLTRPLSHLMGSASRTSGSGCFSGARFGLVTLKISPVSPIFGFPLAPVFLKVPCSLAEMFRYVPGLVASFSCSASEFLCALAALRALIE